MVVQKLVLDDALQTLGVDNGRHDLAIIMTIDYPREDDCRMLLLEFMLLKCPDDGWELESLPSSITHDIFAL